MNKFILFLIFISVFICILHSSETKTPNSIIFPSENYITAESFRVQGKFELSLKYYDIFYSNAISSNRFIDAINAATKRGIVYWNLGQIANSYKQFRLAKDLYTKIHSNNYINLIDSALNIIDLYNAGKESRIKMNRQESIKHFKSAIYLSEQIHIQDFKLKCLRQLSVNYLDDDNLAEFFKQNSEAITIANSINNIREKGICLNNIGIYYSKITDYSNALNNFEKSLEIANIYKDVSSISDVLNNLSILYAELGDFDKSIDCLLKVYSIDNDSMDARKKAITYNNIGIVYRRKALLSEKKDDFDLALKYFIQAKDIAIKNDFLKIEIETLNNIGSIYTQISNNSEALSCFKLSLQLSDKVTNNEENNTILNNIGIAYYNLGEYKKALEFFQKTIVQANNYFGKKVLWETYLDLANMQKKQHHFDEARENYISSISIIEEIRSSIEAEDLKAIYFGSDKRMDSFNNLIDLLIKKEIRESSNDLQKEIFYYLEKAKARAFLDSLAISNLSLTEDLNWKLSSQEKMIIHEISKAHKNLLLPNLLKEQIISNREHISLLESQLERIKREIRIMNPRYANLKYPNIVSIEYAKEKIFDKKTAYLIYIVSRDYSYCFSIFRDAVRIFPIPNRNEMKQKISSFIKSISDKESYSPQIGFELFNILVAPALSEGIENLVIIPDDTLYYLPYEALPTSYSPKEWLIKKFAINYIPSISSLHAIQIRNNNLSEPVKKDIIAIGDPDIKDKEQKLAALMNIFPNLNTSPIKLNFAKTEINKITSYFKENKKDVFTGAAASEELIKSNKLNDYHIIHLVAHGLIDDKIPSRSSILLCPGEDIANDGILQTREIYSLKIKPDLVVLSACQTGLGRLLRGEGIEGLNRAFFYAGASSVLMTLWSVNDQASAQLMDRFYYHLNHSASIMSALQKAKLDMIESPYYSHPYYWAGYILSGDGFRVIFPRTVKIWIWIGIGVGFSVSLIAIFRLRKKRKKG